MSADIALLGLTKRFGEVLAVDDLSVDVQGGRFFALVGPSGCGKTTTLRMIGGFEEPTAGRIRLGSEDVTDLPPFKRDVNTVFQSYALFPHLSVEKNLAFGLERRKAPPDNIRKRVAEVLELTDLVGMEKRRPAQLSGGEQQRVALARALVNRPRALLLDEPLGALDLRLRRRLQLELKRIQQEVGITFVHVTHDQEEAMTMADEIAVMNRGRIEQRGSAEELYERPRTAFVASFLGTSNLIGGSVASSDGRVADFVTHDGVTLTAPATAVPEGARGSLCAGVRPEKVLLFEAGASPPSSAVNRVSGVVRDAAFLGVHMQYVVVTPAGDEVVVVEQNMGSSGRPSMGPGAAVLLAWRPEHTFVVESGAPAASGERHD